MRAARIVPGADGGRIEIQDVADPIAGAGQVLVRVRASGLNRGELTQVREARTGNTLPAGVEFAGEVAALGAGASGWQVGDRVMGHGRGGQAQFTVAEPGALMRVPENVSWEEAGTFVNVFMTAHDAIVTNGQLAAGESVLVNAASSGIGIASMQIAACLGARPIIGTSQSPTKLARLAEYGADLALDTATPQLEAVMKATGDRGVDLIVDSVGASAFEANLKSLAIKGRLVNIGRLGGTTAQLDLLELWRKRVKLIGVTFRSRSEAERIACVQACARDLLPALAAGRLRWPIDRAFPLASIAEAHAYMLANRHFGKIVISVD